MKADIFKFMFSLKLIGLRWLLEKQKKLIKLIYHASMFFHRSCRFHVSLVDLSCDPFSLAGEAATCVVTVVAAPGVNLQASAWALIKTANTIFYRDGPYH